MIVMETADASKDERGGPRKGNVVGLHVMRREKGFGEAYGKNRTGDWEYVEYRADSSYITPPSKSFACAECHVKAGADRDFVYHGRPAGERTEMIRSHPVGAERRSSLPIPRRPHERRPFLSPSIRRPSPGKIGSTRSWGR